MPKDPVMLLSYVNTQLRDFIPAFRNCAVLCRSVNMICGTGWQRLIMNMMQ